MTRGTPSNTSAPQAGARSAPPTHEEIAARAYGIWHRKGMHEGHCEQNWRQAEAELRKAGQSHAERQGGTTQ